jgi:hypothetical protein
MGNFISQAEHELTVIFEQTENYSLLLKCLKSINLKETDTEKYKYYVSAIKDTYESYRILTASYFEAKYLIEEIENDDYSNSSSWRVDEDLLTKEDAFTTVIISIDIIEDITRNWQVTHEIIDQMFTICPQDQDGFLTTLIVEGEDCYIENMNMLIATIVFEFESMLDQIGEFLEDNREKIMKIKNVYESDIKRSS